MTTFTGFGVQLRCSFPLLGASEGGTGTPVDVGLTGHAPGPEGPIVWAADFSGGIAVAVTATPGGGYRIGYGGEAVFTISPGADRVDAVVADAGDAGWQRFLCDTVLWWLALMQGRHLVHGAVVADGDELTVLLGPSGVGKTSLSLALLDAGARFFSDDLLCLDGTAGALPGPPLRNVPRERLRGDERIIADFGDEVWAAVDGPVSVTAPVRTLVFLERDASRKTSVTGVTPTALDVLPHVWALPDRPTTTPERFAVLSDLAEGAHAYHVVAGEGDGPDAIADRIRSAVAGEGS